MLRRPLQAVAILAAAACPGMLAASSGGAAAEEIQLAQAVPGYDPMRRPQRPSDADRPPGNPELEDLPDAPGAEETYYLCSGCHSIGVVKQQRVSDARWEYLFNWMIHEQGMPEPDEETRELILNYLKTYFSSVR